MSQSKFSFKWFKIQYFCSTLHLVNAQCKCQSCNDFECVEYSDKLWSHEVRDLQWQYSTLAKSDHAQIKVMGNNEVTALSQLIINHCRALIGLRPWNGQICCKYNRRPHGCWLVAETCWSVMLCAAVCTQAFMNACTGREGECVRVCTHVCVCACARLRLTFSQRKCH